QQSCRGARATGRLRRCTRDRGAWRSGRRDGGASPQESGRSALSRRTLRRGARGICPCDEDEPGARRRRVPQAREHPPAPARASRSGEVVGARAGARSRQCDRAHESGVRAAGVLVIEHAGDSVDDVSTAEFHELTHKISGERGFVCASYKEKCLRRRIAVRMRARGVHTYRDYARVLDADAGEYERLLDTLTINVTKLFRNWEAYAALAEHVVPVLWHREAPQIPVWSAGCSSGDEPYSLAILFHRY